MSGQVKFLGSLTWTEGTKAERELNAGFKTGTRTDGSSTARNLSAWLPLDNKGRHI